MSKSTILFLMLLCLCGAPVQATESIGFREIVLPAAGNDRALDVAIWYPATETQATSLIGDNRVFVGLVVAKDAPALPGRHPMVVMSHGYGGNWNNQRWLAGELVHRGYIVVAPNHPGTTSRDMQAATATRLWERPRDISHVINALTANPAWSGEIAPERIAVVGHSLGGWTVIELAGGRFDTTRLEADCQTHAELAACEVYKDIGVGQDPDARAALNGNLRDTRVKAVVSLDLGLARAFDPASLAAITVPILVIAAGPHNPKIPAALESRYLADGLPGALTRYVEITDAAHYSFLPVCKPGAEAVLDEDKPGDAIICQDGAGVDREAIHRQVADLIIAFLANALPGP